MTHDLATPLRPDLAAILPLVRPLARRTVGPSRDPEKRGILAELAHLRRQ
ncbi:hypothetical protein [Sphingomonas ginkgonis]|nr:hypothetical protein [Sphingomonas ginkgonis]